MRTPLEYLLLLALGAAAALLPCFILGARKKTVFCVLLNCLLGAAVALIPMAAGVFLPAWAVALCGAAGIAGAFFYLL